MKWLYFGSILFITTIFIPCCCKAEPTDTFSHDYELILSDTAFTLTGCKVIDDVVGGHDFWVIAPAFNVTADLLYRIPEFDGPNGGHYAHEFLCLDLPGIALGCALEIIFSPREGGKPLIGQ